MKLGEYQELFSLCLGKLILEMYAQGYTVRMGDVLAHDKHKENSNHYIKLAADINLFKSGKYLRETKEHKLFGDFWKTLHPLCSWGGDFNDGNHYSLIYHGRR